MTQLLIVEDQVGFREAFAHALRTCAGIELVLEAGDPFEAKGLIAQADRAIDLAIFGRESVEIAGVELRSHLLGFHPSCQVAVIGAGAGRKEWARAITIGAVAVFPKSAAFAEIVDGIRRLLAGESIIPRSERIALLEEASHFTMEEQAIRSALARLTPREREIMESLAQGLSDKETAARLGVSTKTVATHMASLLDKIGVDSRLKAVLLAIRFNAVNLD